MVGGTLISIKQAESAADHSEYTIRASNVRFGSKADIGLSPVDVRYSPKSGHGRVLTECPLCARSGHRAISFDHVVRKCEHAWRDRDTECLGCLKIDGEREARRLQHG